MSGTRLKERRMSSSVFKTINGDGEVFCTWFILDSERLFAVLKQINEMYLRKIQLSRFEAKYSYVYS